MRQPNRFEKIVAQAQEPYVLYPVFAWLLLMVVWSWCFLLLKTESVAVEKKAAASVLELVETYEAQMIRNLGNIEQALGAVKYAYEASADPKTLALLRERRLLPPSMLFNISIFNERGHLVASTSTSRQAPITRQSYFIDHRAVDAPDPTVRKMYQEQGEPVLLFSRRLNKAGGNFLGVVQISVPPAYFTSGYDMTRMGNKGVLGLLNNEGVFLARRTGEATVVGGTAHPAPVGAQLDKPSIALEMHTWDGEQRYAGVRPLHGFPLSILVGLSRSEQFEDFKLHERNYLYWAALASFMLIVVALILSRYAWQLSESRRRTRKDQETYYAASKASTDAVFVLRSMVDRQGEITDFLLESVNDRAIEMFRIPQERIVGRTVCDLLPQIRENGMLVDLIAVAKNGEIREHEWENDLPLLRVSWLYRQVIQVEDGVVVILRDISERKRVEARIIYMAHHDSLTGLPNRTLLEDRIQQAILQAQRSGHSVMVAFIDLDNFKFINDCLGHAVGDELLKVIARRLRQTLRQSDTVVRLGGDEFVIVLSGQPEYTEALAGTFQKIRTTIAEPIFLAGNRIEVTSSMGVAVYPDDGEDSTTLLMRADATMYQAKAQGRNNCQFYTAELDRRIRDRLTLQDGLRVALERNEFLLVYQPQVDLRTGQIVGLEALLRWRHPERGIVSSSEFIDLVEETGLIGPIGEWALRTACLQNKAWQDQGLPPITVSVNVSPRQFNDNSLLAQVDRALKDSGMHSRYLCLEVTESMLMLSPSRAIAAMGSLQAMGVMLSIDDFGTGYSNLSALRSFPISRLKIDQSFIAGLPSSESDCAIIKTIISLGQQMNLLILAEGIETQEQLVFLQECGCGEGQGFLLCLPVEVDAIPALLQAAETLTHKATKLA